jgi:nitrate reductase NapD
VKLDDSAEVHIASLLVHAMPANLDRIAAAIEELGGAEVHAKDPVGKILVTLESENEAEILSRISEIQDMECVLNAVLVYHEVELPEAAPNIVEPKGLGTP